MSRFVATVEVFFRSFKRSNGEWAGSLVGGASYPSFSNGLSGRKRLAFGAEDGAVTREVSGSWVLSGGCGCVEMCALITNRKGGMSSSD